MRMTYSNFFIRFVSIFGTFLLTLQSKADVMNEHVFRLITLSEATEFLDSVPDNAREKILYNIRKVRGGIKDIKLFKKLWDTPIWEFRTEYMGIAYRLLAFWDKEEETLVVATHGFKKKQQKTPKSEISHAIEIMKNYFNNKNKDE